MIKTFNLDCNVEDSGLDRFLKAESLSTNTSPIVIFINSTGGDLPTALSICNLIKRLHHRRVITVCTHSAESSACLIFLAAKERIMMEEGILMMHPHVIEAEGDYYAIHDLAAYNEIIRAKVEELVEEVSGKYKNRILNRETNWFEVVEAKELGMVTRIWRRRETLEEVLDMQIGPAN